MTIKFTKGQNNASLHINHVELTEDHRVGAPGMQFWLRSIELCRYVLAQRIYDEAVGGVGGYPDGFGPFLFYQHISFHPALKRLDKPPTSSPITFKMEVDRVNKSSAWFYVTTTDDVTKEILLNAVTMVVWVDKRTRKSALFPDKFRSYIDGTSRRIVSKEEMEGSKIFNNFAQPPPEGVFCWGRRMTYYDCDFNSHVNNSIYVLICLQALEEASLCPTFSQSLGAGGFNNYLQVRNVRVKVAREVRQGSMLNVKLWQTSPLSFRFIIIHVEKRTNVAFCCIDFFQPNDMVTTCKL